MVSLSLAQRGDGWSGKGTAGLALLAGTLTVVPCQPCPGCRPVGHALLQCQALALCWLGFGCVPARAAEWFLCLPLCCVFFSRVAYPPGCCGNQTSSCAPLTPVSLVTGLWPPCPYSLVPVPACLSLSTHLPSPACRVSPILFSIFWEPRSLSSTSASPSRSALPCLLHPPLSRAGYGWAGVGAAARLSCPLPPSLPGSRGLLAPCPASQDQATAIPARREHHQCAGSVLWDLAPCSALGHPRMCPKKPPVPCTQ